MKRSLLILLGIFIVSRLAYTAMGVRFDYIGSLDGAAQLPDRAWLLDDFWRTIFYMHSQSPLFSILTRIGLALPLPVFYTVTFWIAGIVMALSMWGTLRLLNAPQWLCFVSTGLFIVSPPTILYENNFFYTYLAASLLSVLFYLALKLALQKRLIDGLLLISVATALVLLRSSFHLLWAVVIVIFALYTLRADSRRQLALITIPFLLAVALYVKNYAVFGTFSSSSWIGMNLSHVAFHTKPDPIPAGYPTWEHLSFRELDNYGEWEYTSRPDFDNIPSIGSTIKPTSGSINFNHYGYIETSHDQLQKSLTAIRLCPTCYLSSIRGSLTFFLMDGSEWIFMKRSSNYHAITPIRELWLTIVDGKFNLSSYTAPHWFLSIAILLQLCFAVMLTYYSFRDKNKLRYAYLIILFTLLYLVVTYIALDIGENMRFRFEIDPILYCYGVLIISQIYQAIRCKLRT